MTLRILNPAWLPEAPVQGVITHWTAGGPRFSELDARHYHFGIEQDGTVRAGSFTVAHNCRRADLAAGRYAAHTRRRNSYHIGIALCGMMGAQAAPFRPGPAPIRPETTGSGLAAR